MYRVSPDHIDRDHNLIKPGSQSEKSAISADLDLISEEISDNRIHTPPPRIAARFYRPTTNRRKSSAASSRRNSVSSAHSHQSTTRHGAPQSNFVAQHLRRASIIEDRKARLADRAAHAEKVRLRAALSKAAPRSTTNSEERALAAQQARQKNLAEIVAACAEEVKRAKGIAESMKEKREAEGKKLRKDMEERLAEAERRREEILNRGNNMKRGRSLSQPRKSLSPCLEVRETISDAVAASRIQRRWRTYQKKKALKEFTDLGLTIDKVRGITFDAVVDLLAQEKVLVGTAHILRICGLREGEIGSVTEMAAVKTFLSACLILGHPTQVLSGKGGEQEQDLVAKARDLLISFENALARLNAANSYTPPPALLSTLSETYATFYNAFIAWKARDSNALVDMMVLQFVELDSIWQSVKDTTEEAITESYRDGIRENQIKLFVRIKKLAGDVRGRKLIAKAIRESRDTRAEKQPAGDARPRAADSVEPEKRSIEELAAVERSMAVALQTLTAPSTPHQCVTSFVDELRHSSPVMEDNRTITHEIAINKDYRMGEEVLQGRSVLMQATFDSMRQGIASGNADAWILAMAENIRTKLQRLLPEGKAMYISIGERLDSDLVATQLQNKSFSYDQFFNEMAVFLPKLCAPFRDTEIQELIDHKFRDNDVVSRLEALMHGLDILQLDYANYLLQQRIPLILENAAKYETYHFMMQLAETGGSLHLTESAWKIARSTVMTEAARRDPDNINLPRNWPGAEKIYSQMLVNVFTSLERNPEIPETLNLDKRRILRIRADVLRIVTCGAILLQCKNLLKRDVRSQWKTEATRVYMVLENTKNQAQASQGIQAALESSRSMPAATKDHIRVLVNRIIAASEAGVSQLGDPVLRLLMTRLKGHILNRIGARSEKEKLKSASTASESLATLGLPEFVQRVSGIVEEIARVGAVDLEAHGRWYEDISEKFSGSNIGESQNDERMEIC